MKYRVIVTGPAKRDIREALNWWQDNRSAAQAERWYRKILPAISTLAENPDRFPKAPEAELVPTGLRQLHFGASRNVTHRFVFTIVGSEVRVLPVRHVAQQDLGLDDLAP